MIDKVTVGKINGQLIMQEIKKKDSLTINFGDSVFQDLTGDRWVVKAPKVCFGGFYNLSQALYVGIENFCTKKYTFIPYENFRLNKDGTISFSEEPVKKKKEKVEDSFSVGDLVQLKSGGPVMTVEGFSDPSVYVEAHKCVSCLWFDKENHLQRESLLTDSLKKY